MLFLLSSEVWAIGLGDIELDSALNEPLRAEIVLLSASPDELVDLRISLASAETFERYGIDRPVFLQGVEFNVVDRGAEGSVVQIRSRAPISEPFLTFLIEATWSSGRLLREYTVLLDPPTYSPPAMQQAPVVEAPRRSVPSDSGQIEREAAPTPEPTQEPTQEPIPEPTPVPVATVPAPQPLESARSSDTSVTDSSYGSAPEPVVEPEARPEPVMDSTPYNTNDGGDFYVAKGQTLWSVAAHLRPDSRLTINQTMLAIFEANPDAFGGNINMLKAGASLRIPSADEVFQISRNDALSEVQRQHSVWGGSAGYVEPEPATRPSLTLVPPDEEPVGSEYDDSSTYETPSREEEIESRISDLEAADVPNQRSLIEIRDNELAALRQELADIRGEVYEPPVSDTVDDPVIDDPVIADSQTEDPFAADDGLEDEVADDAGTTDDAEADTTVPTNIITTSSSQDEGIVDRIIGFLADWGIIIAALIVVAGGLIWFVRRGDDGGEEENSRPWETLDSDEMEVGDISPTAVIQPPIPDDAIVVVEQDSGVHQILEDTVEAPVSDFVPPVGDASGTFGSLEDTFSSETAVNLDQSDPIAEADFHMAYGLYDQAADLINGALQTDSSDKALISKLCEIYFVWGNRDEFVDAATRLKNVVSDEDSADWHKIVIMGQQIAADHDLFAGAELVGATQQVDLSFDDGGEEAGALDMDFGGEGDEASDVIDLGADFNEGSDATQGGVDFDFDAPADETVVAGEADLDVTEQSPTIDLPVTEATAEMPAATTSAPTFDDPTELDIGTSELPSLDETPDQVASDQESDATAEMNVDELDLGVGDFDETEIATLDDLEATGQNEALSETGINEALADLDVDSVTGSIPEFDPDATGTDEEAASDPTQFIKGIDIADIEDTGMRLAADETGQHPLVSAETEDEAVGLDIDDSLLEATGLTQVLTEDMGVETAAGIETEILDSDATMLAPDVGDDKSIESLPDDAATMLAPMDDDEEDFDFAKTENLPPEAFTDNMGLEATADTPAIAGTDVDLDLDDLTAALKVSEIGDTMARPRDDATVEQPRIAIPESPDDVPTMEMAPDDMSGDLHEARTMTEVGTKLDLARAYVDMGDPAGARSILEEVLDEGDEGQKQQAQALLDSLPS